MVEKSDTRTSSEITKQISDAITRLQASYYGRGPRRARTYYHEDLVLVRLDETFTLAERTLVDRGEKNAIQHIRRRFQQYMEEDFRAIVEQATGRRVEAFLSETNVDQDLSVEVFFLGGPREDMSGFAESGRSA